MGNLLLKSRMEKLFRASIMFVLLAGVIPTVPARIYSLEELDQSASRDSNPWDDYFSAFFLRYPCVVLRSKSNVGLVSREAGLRITPLSCKRNPRDLFFGHLSQFVWLVQLPRGLFCVNTAHRKEELKFIL
jgi:hypothetical protein